MVPKMPADGNRGLVSPRRLAAQDIVLHGGRFVLAETCGIMALLAALGLVVLSHDATRSPPVLIVGALFLGQAANYLTLAAYAADIVRNGSARHDARLDQRAPNEGERRYFVQSARWTLIPLAMVALAAHSEWRARPRHAQP